MATLPPISPRVQWAARLAFQALILLAAAFFSAITAMRFAITGKEVSVPNIVGVQGGDAQQLLSQRSLGMKIADRVYSSLPRDRVVRQSPAAGTRVKLTQRIHVVLSLGTQKVSIPEVQGKTSRAARIELMRAGLQVGEITNLFFPGQEADQVVLQNPPAKATDAGSPRVNLLVAAAPRETAYVMPDLLDLPLAEAQRRIVAAGLRLSKISPAPPGVATRNLVVAQAPLRGARVLAGAAVELQVAE